MSARVFTTWSARHTLRLIISLALSVLFVLLALRNVNLSEVWQSIRLADGGLIFLALLSVAVNTVAKAIRWQILLRPAARRPGFGPVFTILVVGQMVNILIPARLGDLLRAYSLGSQGPGRVFTLGTVMLEKMLDMLCYGLLFVLLLVLIPLPSWVSSSGYSVVGVAGLIFLVLLLVSFNRQRFARFLAWLTRRLPERLRQYSSPRLQSALASLDVLQSRLNLLGLAFWTAVSWSTAILNIFLVLLALDIRLPLSASLLLLIGLQAGISIPSVPGEVGIFEYICILALAIYQVGQAQALSFGLVLHAVVLLPVIVLGLLFLWQIGLGKFQVLAAAGMAEPPQE